MDLEWECFISPNDNSDQACLIITASVHTDSLLLPTLSKYCERSASRHPQ
jgi:hypothetical protein